MSAPGDVFPLRQLGRTSLRVPEICFGGSGLASMPEVFGYDVPEERAVATVRAVLAGPVGFLDTSAGYGDGRSERIIGTALAEVGGPPPGFVLATKVDPDPATGDFSGAAVRRSLESSLTRLGVDRVPLLYLHDPERISFEQGMASDGPVAELLRIQEEGLARHIGVAGGPVDLLRRYLGTGAFEVVLTHNRWTLLDRSAERLIDAAWAAGVAVVNAAPFGGGLLARGPGRQDRYAYSVADRAVLDRAREIAELCAAHEVPLPAAAIQFSTRDPRIAATVIGVTRPERVAETLELSRWPIPEELWPTLHQLAAPADHWQN
ncbi:aldo/keto reductase [Streptomyces sp. DSM 44915]|uniref:Aldo/keto reductase n=1 Tax=Streptomyces chisholmiae TaxID=3075540 RepID=A0ABU2JU60_9ACTN|nr:aldo/keto reductase [Streptomyces sp. DSM 44915]MDT0268296.1 aldo/keto reductase [Streptomyces sp. DSM 44915]